MTRLWIPFAVLATVLSTSPSASASDKVDVFEVRTDGVKLSVSRQGSGPLVIFLHGFPELALSWRHQMQSLSAEGYSAVAPDMRGYGKSDAPQEVDAYDVVDFCADAVGIMDALGEKTAVLVGHDWGSWAAWQCALLRPERFRGLITMSVPFGGRGTTPPLTGMRRRFGDNFFYMLYFQEPGVAEAELGADPRGVFRRLFVTPGTPREPAEISSRKASAGGFLGRIGLPKRPPEWMTAQEMDHYVAEFERTGFRGGLNYYRNLDRNWEITEHLAGRKVSMPTLFIAGERDSVLSGRDLKQVETAMRSVVDDLRGFEIIPGAGHWIQQERAETVNRLILGFLKSID